MHYLDVCCLMGAHIRDITERLPNLAQSTDYYPLLLFHMGTDDTARSSLRRIRIDYRALGEMAKDSVAQVVFLSVLMIKGKGFERDRRIWKIKKWLQDWCHSQGFGYLDHGNCFEKPGLLGVDGVHLWASAGPPVQCN